MKRKGVSSGRLRLSPNEEAFVLKEDYERRRKLRLLQVREQERGIAFQIREDIKRRRYQQLTRLAEELRTEWAESQTQKIRKLEKLYLASLRTLGEGHQQATVHEPDWKALEQQAAERKLKAEIRHKEALKVQKDQKAQAIKQKTRHLQARKDALLVEKQRSARVTRLPPPPPSLFENLDLSKISAVRPSCASYHHLSSLVNREMDAEQPDAHAAAAEEARRREDAERQASQERAERCQKAHIRGSRALTKIRLAQNQEKLLRELEQQQQEDLARRRHTVVQMPAKLFQPPYRRSERKEERQRELEFAFEDMYSAGRKVEGDLVLHLEPEPPPAMADRTRDEDLDLSVEQELPGEAASPAAVGVDPPGARGADGAPQHVPSKLLFKKLLSKIRSQKSLWTVQSECEESHPPSCAHGSSSQEPTTETEASAATQSEVPMTTADSEPLTVESSEPLTVESSEPLTVESSEALTVESLPPCEAEPEEDSGPLAVEGRPPVQVEAAEEAGVPEVQPVPAVESVLLHPQEEAARIRMAARRRKIMDIEEQKQKQLELLEQIERQKLRLESDRFRAQLAQLEGESRPDAQEAEGSATSTLGSCTAEDSHRQMIRSYQRHLLQQNRLHRQSVQAARKQLLQFQSMLRGTHLPAARMLPCPGPGTPGLAPEPWGTSQGAVPCPELQAFDPAQTLSLEPDHRPARRQDLVVPGRAASTDRPSAPALSQTSQTTVQPSSPGPCRALSPPSASEDTAARRLTCGSHRGVSVPSSDTVATQRELLRLLQEQLDAQREVLRARQEVRLQSGQLGACFPPPLGFSAPMPPATSGPGRDPESSNLESEPGIFSDHPGDPQLRATVPSSQQPVSVSGREAPLSDEPLAGAVHVQPEPTKPLSQHPLALLPTVDTLPAELQDTTPPSEPPGPARPVSILHQFLPLHNCLKLLQAQLAIQWDALEARHAAQAQLLARRPWERGHSSAGPGSSWPPPAATSWDSGLSLPAQDRHFPLGPQDEFLPLPQREPCTPKGSLGTESETRESTQRPSEAMGAPSVQASPSQTLSQVMTSEVPREGALALFSQATTPRLQEELKSCSQRVLPAGDGVKASQEMLGHRTSESLTTGLGHPQEAPDRLQAPELQARLQRLSQLLQPQREQLQDLQERLAAQRAALARTRQTAPEDRAVPRGSLATSPPTHPLPLDTSGLAALQQQLDSQKEALRARQAAQEGLLLRRLEKLEQRVCAPWPAGADGRPGPGPAYSPPNLSGLTAAQQTKPQDLLPSRPGEPILGTACPRLPLPLAEAGSTDPRDTGPPSSKRAGQLWGAQTEDQEEPQGQRHEHRPQPAPQEPPSSGPARVTPECPGVPDADVAGRRLVEGGAQSPVEMLSCPPLLSPAAVALAPGTVATSHPEPLHRAVPRRPLKPPVARVQSGLGLQQHELSLIREGESPTPADVCQDRDPLRVSVSREQGLLGDSLARPASAPPTPRGAASEAVKGQDAEQPGVKLGRTLGAAQTWLSPAVEPAEEDGQGTHQEPLSVTISTGSFLSAEDTDVSLTDSEPFSENAGVFGSLGARRRPDPMDMAALVLQRAEAHREDESATARMPTLQEPDLTFPDVQHWQFQPLEPHLDLDMLSPTSGLDLFQASESSRGSRASLPSLTSPCASLRVCPHPLLTTDWPPHPGPAYTTTPHVAEPSEGFEQAFHQLLPELASEESQQVDLASILSIEARDSSECPGPHDPSGQSEQRPEDIHLQLPMGTVPTLATRSPGEACETHRSLLSPSEVLTGTQLPSTASGLCVKPREGAGETAPWAQPAASALADRSAAQVEARTGLARLARSLSSGSSSQSRIPIWETESGRGIMEEPELTLVSLSDVSTTEMDFSTLTLDEKENEAQGSFQGSSEDSSGPCPLTVGHWMAPGSAAFPGCIQGSFREERPCQSHTSCENCHDPEEPPGPGGCLKGTSRQSCPARRRPSTQQRALRPHNYTAEVKPKEERARQDTYAWNSARAKEFHRRTLEKLRARNTC